MWRKVFVRGTRREEGIGFIFSCQMFILDNPDSSGIFTASLSGLWADLLWKMLIQILHHPQVWHREGSTSMWALLWASQQVRAYLWKGLLHWDSENSGCLGTSAFCMCGFCSVGFIKMNGVTSPILQNAVSRKIASWFIADYNLIVAGPLCFLFPIQLSKRVVQQQSWPCPFYPYRKGEGKGTATTELPPEYLTSPLSQQSQVTPCLF